MKSRNTTKLILAIATIGLWVGNLNAKSSCIKPTLSKINSVKTEKWTLNTSKDGIKAYLTVHEDAGKTYLKIKFENTNDASLEFNWSLTHKGKTLISNQNNKIEKLNSIEIFDATMLVPVSNNESLNNFSISITRK